MESQQRAMNMRGRESEGKYAACENMHVATMHVGTCPLSVGASCGCLKNYSFVNSSTTRGRVLPCYFATAFLHLNKKEKKSS